MQDCVSEPSSGEGGAAGPAPGEEHRSDDLVTVAGFFLGQGGRGGYWLNTKLVKVREQVPRGHINM